MRQQIMNGRGITTVAKKEKINYRVSKPLTGVTQGVKRPGKAA